MAAPEPIFICQWRVSEDEIDPISAVQGKAQEAHKAGATWLRVSWQPDDPLHLIMEGWKEAPIDPDTGSIDQGDIRWKDEEEDSVGPDLISLEEAARDLLESYKHDMSIIGYRIDLWNILAAALDAAEKEKANG